jgi:hypothetical protein
MTARSPLWYNSGNLQEMTADEIVEWQTAAIFVYASSPTVVLTVNTASAGNLAAINDTRLQAGATSFGTSAFVAESGTAEPLIVNVAYDRIHRARTTSGVGQTADSQITFPVYWDNIAGGIRAMNLTDFKDTFIEPAIDLLVAGTESNNTGGTYTVTTSATAAIGYTNVSTTPFFIDTRANTALYTAAGIPETLDQPITITSYYLHRRNGADSTPSRNLLLINSNGVGANLIEGATATMKSLIGNWIRYDTANTVGQKIVYTMATSGGSTRGSGVVDTKLNGSGNYQTREAYTTAYRSQEFPDGSPVTVATYALRIAKGG